MKIVYRRCAGLDIHKKSVSACVARRVKGSSEPEIEEAVFGTFTQDLQRLKKWLRERGVDAVDVVGIATDYCVKATAADAVAAGFNTRVLLDLTAGVSPTTTAEAVDSLRAVGVAVS